MSLLPLPPPHARTLLASASLSCTFEVITALSLLTTDSLFFSPPSARAEAAAAKKLFASSEGDHLTLVNVLNEYLRVQKEGKSNLKEWCRKNFVNGRAISQVLVNILLLSIFFLKNTT